MSKKFSILLLILGLLQIQGLTAQLLRGELYWQTDSIPVMFAQITVVDSSGTILAFAGSNDKGFFEINIIDAACYVKIFCIGLSELQLINLHQISEDTINLGKIPMFEPPPYLIHVQFVGISNRKEKRKQKQILRTYNKIIRSCEDIIIDLGDKKVKMIAKTARYEHTERLRIIYVIDINAFIYTKT